jgi:hypothetical protein
LTVVKNKVKHPKVCFTIECHLCHIDDQSILAAIVPIKKFFYQFTPTFSMPHFNEIDRGRIISHLENGRTVIMNVAAEFRFIKKET